MAYTVKQVAAMSGVSVRTLHYYDEAKLLKPAYCGTNGYRFYEEPLLKLQQILFYRELGFELKKIKRILGSRNFEIVAALQSHRKQLERELKRMRTLIETVDNTIKHLKWRKKMKSEDIFAGFHIAAGEGRFGEHVKLGGYPHDCKLSGKDTNGALCVFEFTGSSGGPRHLHHEQDEWVYIVEGEFDFVVGKKQFRAGPGESVFIPRKVSHRWGVGNGQPGKVINTYQPAGKMEDFFREVGKSSEVGNYHPGLPTREQMINKTYTEDQVQWLQQLFKAHGMDLLGP